MKIPGAEKRIAKALRKMGFKVTTKPPSASLPYVTWYVEPKDSKATEQMLKGQAFGL
jgi:hypothetical protein